MTVLQLFVMVGTNMREAVFVCTATVFIAHTFVFSLVYVKGF